jgi:diguanylate cyclase (GGDEF)-like protein
MTTLTFVDHDGRLLAQVHELLASLSGCTDATALRAQAVPPLLGLAGADAAWLAASGLEGADVLPPGLLVAAERLRRDAGADPTPRWHLRGDSYLARCPLLVGEVLEGELWLAGDATGAPRLAAAAPLLRAVTSQLGLAVSHLRHLDEARRSADRDGLTRLPNHVRLRRDLEAEHERARRYGGTYGLLLLDVAGPTAGEPGDAPAAAAPPDEVLRAVAGLLDRGRRACVLAARRGGGEFVMLLPRTDLAGTRRIAARLLEDLATLDLRDADGAPLGPTTAAVGCAASRPDDAGADATLARAEAALRRADRRRTGGAGAAPVPAEAAAPVPPQEFERLKAEFLGTASHELRTPLSAILGYAELLQDNLVGPLSAEQADFVTKIERNAQRLVVLVEAMLDAARCEHGSIDLITEDVDFATLCTELVSALEPTARRSRVRFDFTRPVGRLPVRLDARRVRQAIAALIENAVKFTPEGGRVEIRVASPPGGLRIEVSDDGIGIPSDELHHVFRKFYQVDGSPTRLRGGAGLALYVAKAIVEAHGGEIGVESEPGRGSTFWITLPR